MLFVIFNYLIKKKTIKTKPKENLFTNIYVAFICYIFLLWKEGKEEKKRKGGEKNLHLVIKKIKLFVVV